MATPINKAQLHEKILAAGIPIDGVGRNPDGSIRIDFREDVNGATDQQKAQAAAIVAAYDQDAAPSKQQPSTIAMDPDVITRALAAPGDVTQMLSITRRPVL